MTRFLRSHSSHLSTVRKRRNGLLLLLFLLLLNTPFTPVCLWEADDRCSITHSPPVHQQCRINCSKARPLVLLYIFLQLALWRLLAFEFTSINYIHCRYRIRFLSVCTCLSAKDLGGHRLQSGAFICLQRVMSPPKRHSWTAREDVLKEASISFNFNRFCRPFQLKLIKTKR